MYKIELIYLNIVQKIWLGTKFWVIKFLTFFFKKSFAKLKNIIKNNVLVMTSIKRLILINNYFWNISESESIPRQ